MEVVGSIKNYPARSLAVWYLLAVSIGSAALLYPNCHAEGVDPLSVSDAIFTATSATCVTGLVVRSTGNDLSWLGQAVVLLLIQVGGLGIMTFTTYAIFSIGRTATLRHRAVLTATMGADSNVDLRQILRYAFLVTLLAEFIGFIILAIRNLASGFSVGAACWHALFHSVSAFCNAGFGLYDDSLMRYQGDVIVNLTIIGLIITGGIGFPVILDLKQKWNGSWRDCWEKLTLHSKLMLIGTAMLLLFGVASFLVLEWRNVLSDMPYWKRMLVALFYSTTCRTAGFNTVDVSKLTNAMLFVSILLMMVGAGPGSTAGGFKVSTLSILVMQAWSSFRGRRKVNVFRRTIPPETVTKAMVTAILFSAVATVALTVLLAFEQSIKPHLASQGLFLDAAFEVVSALGTVGLSAGLTDDLSTAGRVIVIVLMFLGRLGPITVFAVLSRGEERQLIEFSNEEPFIG